LKGSFFCFVNYYYLRTAISIAFAIVCCSDIANIYNLQTISEPRVMARISYLDYRSAIPRTKLEVCASIPNDIKPYHVVHFFNLFIKNEMNNNEIDIGKLILQKLKEENLSVTWLAEKMYIEPSYFHKMLKKKSIDTNLLLNISKVLHYNFFQYYHII
jgi:hypothetical protein